MQLEATVVLKADTKQLQDALKDIESVNNVTVSGNNLVNARTKRETVVALQKAFDSSKANTRLAITKEKNRIYTDPEAAKQYKSIQRAATTEQSKRLKAERNHRKATKKIDNDAKREANEIRESHLTNIGYIDNYFKSLTSELKRFDYLFKADVDADKYEKKIEQDIKLADAKSENERNNMLLQSDLILGMFNAANEGELKQNAELIKQAIFHALQISGIKQADVTHATESKAQLIRENRDAKKDVDDNRKENRKEILQDQQDKRMEYLAEDHKLKMERMSFNAPLSFKDFENILGFATGSIDKDDEELGITLDKVKNIAKGLAFGAMAAFVVKTLTTVFKLGKSIVGVFTNVAKQTEVFKNMMNLILTPISLLFTLLFVPLLIAVLPMIKTMFSWVAENKDAIMAVGEKLGSVFSPDKLGIISKALDGVLTVINGLVNIFTTNASMIDTSSLDEFISSTVLAIANMIQDILLGLVAFCYSPEGQAFINSVSYSVGKVIGSILTSLVALIPVIFQSIHMSIGGVINGIFSSLVKTAVSFFNLVDEFTGGAVTGVLTSIINLINTAINALNSINIMGFQPFNIGTLDTPDLGTMGSTISNTFDQGIVNNFNINNMMNIPNSGVLKDVMSTGVY